MVSGHDGKIPNFTHFPKANSIYLMNLWHVTTPIFLAQETFDDIVFLEKSSQSKYRLNLLCKQCWEAPFSLMLLSYLYLFELWFAERQGHTPHVFSLLTGLLLWEAELHLLLSYWLLLFFVVPPTSCLFPQKLLLLFIWSVDAALYWSVPVLNTFSNLKPHGKSGRNNKWRRKQGGNLAKPHWKEWLLMDVTVCLLAVV